MKKEKSRLLSEGELKNLVELGEILRGIHNRLLLEGKVKVENGKTIFLEKTK
ncbi:MAG: hypothetical protein WCK29_03280 [archaeon]